MLGPLIRTIDFLWNVPTRGLDFSFQAICKRCESERLFVTKSGGELFHCYGCGDETQQFFFTPELKQQLRVDSNAAWQTWRRMPYHFSSWSDFEKTRFFRGHPCPAPDAMRIDQITSANESPKLLTYQPSRDESLPRERA